MIGNIDKQRKLKKAEAKIQLSIPESIINSRYRESQEQEENKIGINMKYEGEESTDSKYIEQYLSRNYKDEGESNEYMPLKPTPYMLEKPFYHQERLQAGETSSDIKH